MAETEEYKNCSLATVAISGELRLNYTKKEIKWAKQERANQLKSGWWTLPDNWVFIPATLGR
jgi:hypothetical protein